MVALLVTDSATGPRQLPLTECSSTAWRIVDLDRTHYSGGDGLADEVGGGEDVGGTHASTGDVGSRTGSAEVETMADVVRNDGEACDR